ncbi:MAG TPA: PhzF family phenazine biosynthesis protein [Solirubrobacterales bacterium]|jgi:trans-2,3-dihydro-3-hydroxyanthranilate isomerase
MSVEFDRLAGSLAEDVAGVAPGEGDLAYVLLDVFTDTPLEGNQLAVFADGRGLDAGLMQRLAREMNLSETVFVLPAERGGDARIRIFTPLSELPFAGHPTLGTAFAVGSALGLPAVRLETGVGIVPVELERDRGRIVFGRMQQTIPEWATFERAAELLAALGVERSGLPVEAYANGPLHVYVELESEEAVAALRPDMAALAAIGEIGANCFAGSGRRWKTRMFAPADGVPEDPATGSAAGPLAIHLCRHGRISFGEEIEIRQGAELGRPSVLHARADGTPEAVERVEVAGAAVIVAGGRLSPAGIA